VGRDLGWGVARFALGDADHVQRLTLQLGTERLQLAAGRRARAGVTLGTVHRPVRGVVELRRREPHLGDGHGLDLVVLPIVTLQTTSAGGARQQAGMRLVGQGLQLLAEAGQLAGRFLGAVEPARTGDTLEQPGIAPHQIAEEELLQRFAEFGRLDAVRRLTPAGVEDVGVAGLAVLLEADRQHVRPGGAGRPLQRPRYAAQPSGHLQPHQAGVRFVAGRARQNHRRRRVTLVFGLAGAVAGRLRGADLLDVAQRPDPLGPDREHAR
jgi:hypothetical protein